MIYIHIFKKLMAKFYYL
uniref:Uncharacterized protein n=1 Tax=Arundo donax TaxID=35708 RepID=A0A0A9H058_ARUDO